MKYVWITKHRDSFPVAVMCDVLRVSTSGYYASLDREPSPRAQRHERIQQAVQQVHAESFGIYGSRKIADELHLDHSDFISVKSAYGALLAARNRTDKTP